jgi:hypothetical protein
MKEEKNLSPIKFFCSLREFAAITGLSLSSVNRLFYKHREEPPYNRILKLGRRVLIPFSVIKDLYGKELSNEEMFQWIAAIKIRQT